jgi:sugar-specific transcriptional regulator TrmB
LADFLAEKRREIDGRLRELKPLVDEYNQLEAAATALAGVGGSSATRATGATAKRATAKRATAKRATAKRGRRARAKRATGATAKRATATRRRATAGARRTTARKTGARRGRPRGSGTRSVQALGLVRTKPGITIPELAKGMGIKQNYLYRVLPGLESDGLVTKKGRGWHPKSK